MAINPGCRRCQVRVKIYDPPTYACIPLIISPIDRTVDIAMATVYRPVASAAFGNPNN
eukprot:m.242726 g.242726  ORF g.242726 m.242726 type:complete len:58 (+) comp26343_c0_seq2:2340-2513(+)